MNCLRFALNIPIRVSIQLPVFLLFLILQCVVAPAQPPSLVPAKADRAIRIATYNVSFHRSRAGELSENLTAGDKQAERIAAVIRAVRPDILLLNEVDYSDASDNASIFANKYLTQPQTDLLGGTAWEMPHRFSAAVNTGEPSGLDLNNNLSHSDPEDAWGYGAYPGQYGMAVLSRFEIATESVRTFQNLLWSRLPGALRPQAPGSAQPYYVDAVWTQLRLPSKSFWDVPISTPFGSIRVLASHPTPPAFDGPEDRNGCRNHDEIRALSEYIEGRNGDFFVDDKDVSGGLREDQLFVIAGDLNSDPVDGGSRQSAILNLLTSPKVFQYPAPRSSGAVEFAAAQGGANLHHMGDPSHDTADFSDNSVGNLRVDYVLPSHQLRVAASGVLWPASNELSEPVRSYVLDAISATDHRLAWVDVILQ